MKNYSYTILLSITLLIALTTKGYQYITNKLEEPTLSKPIEISTSASKNNSSIEELAKEDDLTSIPTTSTKSPTTTTQTVSSEEKVEKPTQPLTSSYFDDALFIGDSRTVGLSEYGDLGTADVFADTGMNVYKIWNANITLPNGSRTNLDTLLEKKDYKKIYIMLGINELGYDYKNTVDEFENFMKEIEQREPNSIIFIEANLHVTKEKSDSSDIFNNQNIDRFNQAIGKFANQDTRFYIDVNPLFDDETNSLSEEFTADSTHILGKYYSDWVTWLLTKAVTP